MIGRVLWWLYVLLLLAMFASTMMLHVMGINAQMSWPLLLLSGLVDLLAIAGLLLYLLRIRVLTGAFWRWVLVMSAAKYAVGLFLLLRSAWVFPPADSSVVMGAALGGVLALPLLFAVWRYAAFVGRGGA